MDSNITGAYWELDNEMNQETNQIDPIMGHKNSRDDAYKDTSTTNDDHHNVNSPQLFPMRMTKPKRKPCNSTIISSVDGNITFKIQRLFQVLKMDEEQIQAANYWLEDENLTVSQIDHQLNDQPAIPDDAYKDNDNKLKNNNNYKNINNKISMKSLLNSNWSLSDNNSNNSNALNPSIKPIIYTDSFGKVNHNISSVDGNITFKIQRLIQVLKMDEEQIQAANYCLKTKVTNLLDIWKVSSQTNNK